mmetsp:Transcript_98422/g.190091  ORF Transcript_98422/g.190091 Transcript_98422/m.190091 type:complete len:82 (-) Transcript_98422:213-458(-)
MSNLRKSVTQHQQRTGASGKSMAFYLKHFNSVTGSEPIRRRFQGPKKGEELKPMNPAAHKTLSWQICPRQHDAAVTCTVST